jgi:hypothetical protein
MPKAAGRVRLGMGLDAVLSGKYKGSKREG